jgi:hypothetical protein
MIVGVERQAVGRGTLVFIPPGQPHAVRNIGDTPLVYVSATSPPRRSGAAGRDDVASDREIPPRLSRPEPSVVTSRLGWSVMSRGDADTRTGRVRSSTH